MEPDIDAALRDLTNVANRLGELLEWRKVEQQGHRPHTPPAFQLRDHTRDDIIDLYSWFLNLSLGVRQAIDLATPNLGHHQRTAWEQRLAKLEHHVGQLGIFERFIRP